MFNYRIISTLVLFAMVGLTIAFNWFFVLVVATLTGLGLYEFFTMVEKKGVNIYKYFGVITGVLIPLSIFFRFELTKGWEFLFIVLALFIMIVLQFARKDSSQAISAISVTLFGIVYVAWCFSFFVKLKYLPGGNGLVGAVILITKGGDIGAYLTGVKWGRIPLIPRISPNKSIEGAFGGVVFSLLCGLACRPFLPFSLPHLILVSICLGVIGQLGDLSESLFKRDCQVKDAGKFIPGMGGVLDVIDSLLFTVPVFYFYVSVVLRQ